MTQRSHFSEELAIVPRGWVIAAVIAALLVETLFLVCIPRWAPHDLPPQPWYTLMGIVGAVFMAATLLLIGYIYADAQRRGMNALLWVFLIILIPKLIGFVAYFLLRKPLLAPCPQCGTAVSSDFGYCAKCGYALSPSCTNCGRMLKRDYVVCPYCGKTVTGGSSTSQSVVS
jgi:RNA polymerase subunit RPABC4/transcription elongation factor Spt4